MPDTQWLQELESAGSRYSALSTRLIAQMEQLARHGNEKDQVGRWRLTTEQVAAVRDGSSGGGVYKAMTTMLKGERDKSAADWLWTVVAAMQFRGLVSADAQRRNKGKTLNESVQLGWRSVIGIEWKTWSGMKMKALEIVLRIQGNQEMHQVPRIMKADKQRYWQLVRQRLVEGGGAALAEALLWILAVEHGVEVEWMLKDLEGSVLIQKFETVCDQAGREEQAVQELTQLRVRVRQWMRARSEEGQRGYLVAWFAGWSEVMRKVAAERGLQVIAVDIRKLGKGHRLNVQQDLLQLAPQIWCLEVLDRLGLCMGDLWGHWVALDCTASSRSDPSNRTRKGKEVFYNYRQCQHPYRIPQHSAGTEKGDKCRQTDRLAEAAMQVMEQSRRGGVLEQPDGQLQWTKQLRTRWSKWKECMDYCMLWSQTERRKGFQWQKMAVCWVLREDGKQMQLKKEWKCQRQCSCRKMVNGTMKHIGQVEAMTEVMKRTGKSREELKCRYPEELVRRMLCWLEEGRVGRR